MCDVKCELMWHLVRKTSAFVAEHTYSIYDRLIVCNDFCNPYPDRSMPFPLQLYDLTLTTLWPIGSESCNFSAVNFQKKAINTVLSNKITASLSKYPYKIIPDTTMTFALTSVWPIPDKLMSFPAKHLESRIFALAVTFVAPNVTQMRTCCHRYWAHTTYKL